MARRMLADGTDAWMQQIRAMLPAMADMARIAVTPEWVRVHDFAPRFASAIEQAVALTPTIADDC
jgi:hypothetical protein